MKGGSALGRVLGHGAARSGMAHWWQQRVTAIALIPLALWFVSALLAMPGFNYTQSAAWLAAPWHAVLLCLLLATLCWHSSLGLQVVIEDYVHGPAAKTACLLFVTFAHVLIAVAGIFAVLKVAFGTH